MLEKPVNQPLNQRKELLMSLKNEYRRDHDRRLTFWLALGLLVCVVLICAIFL